MCKKITLIIAVVVLLAGTKSIIAQERDADRPGESRMRDTDRSAERQPIMREPVERGDIEPGRRERVQRGDQPEPEPPVVMRGRRQPAAPMAPAETGPAQEKFGKWLDELTKAYRANDREKMGELIRQMQQLRQRIPGKVSDKRGQDYDQGPKKVEKVRPSPEKKAPKVAEKAPQPVKKPAQVWKGGVRGAAEWGVCPWCGRCLQCGAMVGRRMGMAFQQRGFGRFRPEGGPPPAVKDRQTAPELPEDVVRPMLPGPPRGPARHTYGGPARRGWAPIAPMNPAPGRAEPMPEPVEPEED